MLRSWSPYSTFVLLVIGLTFTISAFIALDTPFNVHPDEISHTDGFCYFEANWWPPDLNSDMIEYSPQGESRVYSGELVYLVYGKLGWLLRPIADSLQKTAISYRQERTNRKLALGQTSTGSYVTYLPAIFQSTLKRCEFVLGTYRLLNTLLLAVTLLVLFVMGRKHALLRVIAMLMLVLPQVLYIYSYANSDAWAISVSLFLFAFVLRQKHPFASNWNTVGLAVLTGLVLLAKQNFWLALPFVYLLVFLNTVDGQKHADSISLRVLAARVVTLAVLATAIAAPLRIIYPLTQGNFAAGLEQTRETHARIAWRPSHPTAPGYRLADKGITFRDIARDRLWYRMSAESFYAVFGYMNVFPPNWIYVGASAIALAAMLLTAASILYLWPTLTTTRRVLFVAAPFVIVLCVAASMYNTWTYDYQPQGRYLYPALAPLGLLLGGTIDIEFRWQRNARLIMWAVAYALCLYVVWQYILQNSALLNV